MFGICVSRQWLVVAEKNTTSIYSLPDLQVRGQVTWSCRWPRADSNGVVYGIGVGRGFSAISMLEISDSGNVTELGRLTVERQLTIPWCYVAAGPQPGQLCVGLVSPSRVYIINITTDSIIHRPAVPPEIQKMDHIATLPTGEILVSDEGGNLAWYRSVSEPAVLLTDTPVTGQRAVMLGNINQFLVAAWSGSHLYVLDGERTWHTVNVLNGEEGVWLPFITDVAVWEGCVWVADGNGALVLLCPV